MQVHVSYMSVHMCMCMCVRFVVDRFGASPPLFPQHGAAWSDCREAEQRRLLGVARECGHPDPG